MQTQRTVKLYVGNQIDGTIEVDPDELAAEFVQAALGGFDLPQRASLEFAYRWWIADPKGRNSSWDEGDWETVVDGLVDRLKRSSPADKEKLWKAVGG